MEEKTQNEDEQQPENADHKHEYAPGLDYSLIIPEGFWDKVHMAIRVIEEKMCNHPWWWGDTLEPKSATSSFTLDGYEYTVKISRDEKVI